MPVVDAHTHIQDDLTDFDAALAAGNLAGTQASVNAYSREVIDAGLAQGRLVRRTMMDVTHGCFYSWFAEIAEGRRGRLDAIIEAIGDNSVDRRRQVGRMLVHELHDSRFTEYAEWLRFMFRLYDAVDFDPLDPHNFDRLWEIVAKQRNDPAFAARVLQENNIVSYVTSIENRDRLSMDPLKADVAQIDLAYATHPEAYSMFDLHYLIWPEGATDLGFFLAGRKYEAEKYLLHIERFIGRTIRNGNDFKEGIKDRLLSILYSPTHNPSSRIRYSNVFYPIDYRLVRPCDPSSINAAIRFRKNCVHADDLKHLTALATTAVLEALDDIGADMKRNGEEYGSCLQMAVGVTYFMDTSREIQSMPVYAAGIPQDDYPAWMNYPNINFEYIVAHQQLYEDFSNAAKQVGNVSVGPWWHFFRNRKIAAMMVDQLTMGPISSIASGFTDARFVEMLVAKYRSVRWGIAAALAEMVDDPSSSMQEDAAMDVMQSILFENPAKLHHLPLPQSSCVCR
jgi:hypothetical protein